MTDQKIPTGDIVNKILYIISKLIKGTTKIKLNKKDLIFLLLMLITLNFLTKVDIFNY